jgi:ubiquinone/menaquinone biosynthesis C-methylase UbiE
MAETDKVFAGNIPEIYDRFLVPVLFEPYAIDLAGRAARRRPRDVLETAAGTGVLTRALDKVLAADARIVATDLNQPMLDRAAAAGPSSAQVARRQADALALPFADGSFDLVLCQFGAMFFPDKIKGYREAYRVLKPGGGYFFSVWDEISTSEFADVVAQALAKEFPQDPPRFMERTPHGYHDVERIRAELAAAGFKSVSTSATDHVSRAPSARDAAVAYCHGTPWRNEIEARDASRLESVTQAAAQALARRFGTGAIEGRIRAITIVAAR